MKRVNNLISLQLVSVDQSFNITVKVDRHISCANLITLISKEIKKINPDFSPEENVFLHKGKNIVFNARSLASEDFNDGDTILIQQIEDDHKLSFDIDDLDIVDISLVNSKIIEINLVSHDHDFYFKLNVYEDSTGTELIDIMTEKILEQYPEKSKNEFYFIYSEGRKLSATSQTLENLGIKDGETFYAFEIKPLLDENLELEVSVIIDESNKHEKKFDFKLNGLLKFCLIKNMSLIIDKDLENYKTKLNKKMKHILEIISGGNIDLNQTKNSIMSMLKKFEGINILNFSKFVDTFISNEELIEIYNTFPKEDKIIIQKANNCLASYSKYMKKFEEDFETARKQSIFEWRITSMTIVDRKDLKNFEETKNNCPNRVDKILFHGTGIIPSSKILSDMFIRSENSGYQFGKGVYFTDFLDYAWYYGGNAKKENKDNQEIKGKKDKKDNNDKQEIKDKKENKDKPEIKDKKNKKEKKDNRVNLNIIPKIGERFVMVGSYIYYDKKGFKRVYNHEYNPGKNEINFAYADSETHTIYSKEPDKTKFYGTEYVIHELNQICPFLGCSLKRDEFCVIWRDINFSPKPVYKSKFDEIFKQFLKQRMEYIQEQIKFNVYPCETSEEALELVKRKKYNKIILISNAGNDCAGRQFVIDARKIIGNNVIALFLCYNIEHLKWIKKMKNALFSNDPQFYENYLQSFVTNSDIDEESKEQQIRTQLIALIIKMQKKYKINFNFDNDFLKYPYFKKEGHFSDLTF